MTSAAASMSTRKCGWPECNKEGAKKKCAGCLEIFYCAAECQKGHWQSHAKTCCERHIVRLEATLERQKKEFNAFATIARSSGALMVDAMREYIIPLGGAPALRGSAVIETVLEQNPSIERTGTMDRFHQLDEAVQKTEKELAALKEKAKKFA